MLSKLINVACIRSCWWAGTWVEWEDKRHGLGYTSTQKEGGWLRSEAEGPKTTIWLCVQRS